ncbi:MAG: DNA-binding protein [Thermoplasmata archaeon]
MIADDDELQRIRKKKEMLLKQSMASQQEDVESANNDQYSEERKKVLRQILTSEAKERLARIRLVRPEFVENVENQLISLALSGRLNNVIDDETLVKLLEKMAPPKRETKIVRW